MFKLKHILDIKVQIKHFPNFQDSVFFAKFYLSNKDTNQETQDMRV